MYDIVIIGGGIVGTATALSLLEHKPYNLLLIESEKKLAAHQTGNNSGVIHSGLYYKPGSLKAKNCVEGRELLYNFCDTHKIKYERCGKIVVATDESQISSLKELLRRGKENGLDGLRQLSKDELFEYEPNVNGIAGLFVPQTGIIDYTQVTETYAKLILEYGGDVETSTKFISLYNKNSHLIVETSRGEVETNFLVNCGGLQSDRIAKICGLHPKLQIIPFRGEYYKLKKEKSHLVKNLIYPVPDPQYPFLGVHFTRMINGDVEAGPNAVLAFKREGYSHKDFSFTDIFQMVSYKGFWKMAAKHYKMGFDEFRRSLSKKKFVEALQKLIPAVDYDDVYPAGAGVRAQALEPDGKLVDDFRIIEADKMIHVLNAPSPAATASLSIGRTIAEKIRSRIKK